MIKLFIKFIIGALIIPLGIAVSIAFYSNICLVKELSKSLDLFVWGIVAYVVLHLLFYKPTFLYVFGHEAVHAGLAWIFGGKIKSFKVSEEGGAVQTDKSNFVIELGPYFVPIYAIVIAFVYFVLISSYNIDGSIFIFLIGFALAMHLVMTIEILKLRQPDMLKSGYFFSIVLVYLLNIIVISLIFSLVFPTFSIKRFFVEFYFKSRDVYIAVVKQLFF